MQARKRGNEPARHMVNNEDRREKTCGLGKAYGTETV